MSLIGTVANYGGRQPDNTQNVKQFISSGDTVIWTYKKMSTGINVITPVDKKRAVLIDNDLYVNGSIYNPSDINLKENINVISEDKKDNLINLEPVEFEFKKDNKKHYGFIAQDIEKIYPELVNNNEVGYKTVNYIELIPLLLSKIKDMQKEIDNLKEHLHLDV
jgi:hypothetical protein